MAVLVDNAMEVEVTVDIVVVDMDLVTVVVLDVGLDRAMDLRVDVAREDEELEVVVGVAEAGEEVVDIIPTHDK